MTDPVWPPASGRWPAGNPAANGAGGAAAARPWFLNTKALADDRPAPAPDEAVEPDDEFRSTVHAVLQTVADGVDTTRARDREHMRTLVENEVQRRLVDRLLPERLMRTARTQNQIVAAVLDELFGLGPLQPFVQDPAVENVDINGCDQVWVDYADGRRERGPAVAATDEELIEKIRLWSRQGNTAREFSVAAPLLNTALHEVEGARLSAAMSVTPRPYVSIRCHRLVDIDLHDLLQRGTIDRGLAGFFAAAVRARKNIVVTGGTGAGKTTFARALTSSIDPAERIATLETDFELFLDRLPHRHRDVIAFEARQANSEGRGAITLHDLIPQCLRHNPRRIIVGEVRSTEILPMLEAMQSGHEGSFCTLHANSGEDAFNRILLLALRGGVAMPTHAIHLMVGMSVDLVVHLSRTNSVRYVSQVLEVLPPGDTERPAINHIYRPGPDGRAVPGVTPQCLPELMAAGFDATSLNNPNGLWGAPQ